MSREVPSGWRRSQLGDMIKLEHGKALAGTQRREGAVPVFGSSGIVGYHNKAATTGPSIVISRKGSLGGVFYVDGSFWPIDTTYFVVQKDISDWRWLTYLLKFASLEQLNEATGVPGLNRDKAAKKVVLVPPLHEQRRIAEILSSVDEAIAATRAVIEQTRKVKQGVLERLLTKGIGHTRFKQTEIGEIPEGWDLAEVQEHFHVQLGKMLSKAAKVGSSPSPYLRNANVQWGRINTEDLLNMDFSEQEKRKFRLQPGDLLVCEGGEVGRCAIWNDGKEMYYQKALHRVRERTGIVRNQFLMYVLLRTFTSKALSAGLVGTNSIAHFTSEQFLRLKFPVPHADEQNTICETLAALDLSTNENASKMDSLLSLKSALMSDLLTGRMRVTDALPMAAE